MNDLLVAMYGKNIQLFWDANRNCYYILKEGDLAVDCLQKDQVIDAWFELIDGEDA